MRAAPVIAGSVRCRLAAVGPAGAWLATLRGLSAMTRLAAVAWLAVTRLSTVSRLAKELALAIAVSAVLVRAGTVVAFA